LIFVRSRLQREKHDDDRGKSDARSVSVVYDAMMFDEGTVVADATIGDGGVPTRVPSLGPLGIYKIAMTNIF
jgi:hypothetical protein